MLSKRRFRFTALSAALALSAGILTACGSAPASSTSTTTSSSHGPVHGGTLQVGLNANPESLNPYLWKATVDRQVFENIYEPLVDNNTQGKIVPRLAKSWHISKNGKVYTFSLQHGVKFQNGKPLTAADVKYSIQQAMAPTDTRTTVYLSVIKKIVANNAANTVTLDLSQADNTLLQTLVDVMVTPDQPGLDLATHPIGTGPFKLLSWAQNQKIVLTHNPYYWRRGLPYLNKIVYTIVPDPSTLAIQLTDGQVDIGTVSFAQVKQIQASSAVHLVTLSGARNPQPYMLVLNNRNAPLNNQYVREAISWAINRQQIHQDLLGVSPVKSSVFPKGTPWHDPNAISYDHVNLSKAKQLLAKAGYPHGFSTTLIYFTISTDFPTVAGVIQQDLKQVGINVHLQPMEIASWVNTVFVKHQFAMGLTANTPKDNAYSLLAHDYGSLYKAAIAWNDPAWYSELDQLPTVTNTTQYHQMLDHLIQVVQQQQPSIVVDGWPILGVASNKVHGFHESPRQIFRLWRVWISGS